MEGSLCECGKHQSETLYDINFICFYWLMWQSINCSTKKAWFADSCKSQLDWQAKEAGQLMLPANQHVNRQLDRHSTLLAQPRSMTLWRLIKMKMTSWRRSLWILLSVFSKVEDYSVEADVRSPQQSTDLIIFLGSQTTYGYCFNGILMIVF